MSPAAAQSRRAPVRERHVEETAVRGEAPEPSCRVREEGRDRSGQTKGQRETCGARGAVKHVEGRVCVGGTTVERSLDNFFAKRDKKKKKERSSRAASAAGAAGGAGGSSGAAGAAGGGAGAGARPGDGGTAGAGATGPGAAAKAATKDEDEWKEFEQKEVDYSGLRVQAMQISEKEEDDNEKREDPGDNWEEGGGGGGGVEKSSGPWNKTAPVQAPPAAVIVTETPEPAMTSGVYRPPGARLTTTRKTPQGPPEIYSDTQFPSLQSTAKHVESRKY